MAIAYVRRLGSLALNRLRSSAAVATRRKDQSPVGAQAPPDGILDVDVNAFRARAAAFPGSSSSSRSPSTDKTRAPLGAMRPIELTFRARAAASNLFTGAPVRRTGLARARRTCPGHGLLVRAGLKVYQSDLSISLARVTRASSPWRRPWKMILRTSSRRSHLRCSFSSFNA